jgi:hypothetical protein
MMVVFHLGFLPRLYSLLCHGIEVLRGRLLLVKTALIMYATISTIVNGLPYAYIR